MGNDSLFAGQRRYAAYFRACNIPVEVVDDGVWIEYQRMIVPVGPARQKYLLAQEDAASLLKKLSRALLVRQSGGFDSRVREWFAVICDTFRPKEALSASTRSKVNRGLKRCRVLRISADEMREKGYEVYRAAFDRYKKVGLVPQSKDEFIREVEATRDFEDIIEHWGVYCDDRLIGYATNQVFAPVEVNYSVIKFHPGYLKQYPSYALFHVMNGHYLKDRQFAYVNDGFRSLLHGTAIQDFLINTFNFRRSPVRLRIVYRPIVETLLRATFPCKGFIGRMFAPLAALYRLEEIRRENNGPAAQGVEYKETA